MRTGSDRPLMKPRHCGLSIFVCALLLLIFTETAFSQTTSKPDKQTVINEFKNEVITPYAKIYKKFNDWNTSSLNDDITEIELLIGSQSPALTYHDVSIISTVIGASPDDSQKDIILLVGGTHGDEPYGAEALYKFSVDFMAKYKAKDKKTVEIVNKFEIWIIPVLNVDKRLFMEVVAKSHPGPKNAEKILFDLQQNHFRKAFFNVDTNITKFKYTPSAFTVDISKVTALKGNQGAWQGVLTELKKGVDLNRDFPENAAQEGEGTRLYPGPDLNKSDTSEAKFVKAVVDFASSKAESKGKKLKLLLDIHTGQGPKLFHNKSFDPTDKNGKYQPIFTIFSNTSHPDKTTFTYSSWTDIDGSLESYAIKKKKAELAFTYEIYNGFAWSLIYTTGNVTTKVTAKEITSFGVSLFGKILGAMVNIK